ncbi:hypothetical protein NSK_008224 [Nannochloropsis salina CCMP1776]|uniref:Gfo/Idh/MocA-like oxidoreductase N-terminal domain-containing protein n=1 Tax=Nannochloropsis salina CCMP1776 TaxID=1027361 RepID=A0A4D9CSF6_9STRA|nr:hypothetical protein NSK_008224 [Nannochloropsis salina CCMP1776]|eukprot:TFJ80483.1 hypothetical protein NSK_008224 [Nannochloropsis salina CCMP1776]
MGTIRAAAFYGSRTSMLAGIVDADEAKAAELGRQYHAPAFSNLSTALRALPNVRAVWICTPTPLHTESIKEAMEAGLAVGIEKPVAIQTDDIRLCYQWAAEKNVPLYCSFQRRIDPSYVQLLQTVKEGKIGDIRSVRAVFRDHPVPSLEFLRLGGDIFHDLVVHDADFIMHLLQETPSSVYATGSAFHPSLRAHRIIDTAHCLLHFPSGVLASIELSRSSPYGYDQRIEVCGTEGMLYIKNELNTHVVSVTAAGGIAHANPVNSFPERFARAYVMEVEDFGKILNGKSAPTITCEDSINSTRVAQACGRSVIDGRPVPL